MDDEIRRYEQIDVGCIIDTADKLQKRIATRFPDSGLSQVCLTLAHIAQKAALRSDEISRPIRWVRNCAVVLSLSVVLGLVMTLFLFGETEEAPGTFEFLQILEAAINDIVLIGAGIFFLVSWENRIKRKKALDAIHELRSLAHIIDMHQLSKDPITSHRVTADTTGQLEERPLTRYQMSRYLDYCSEMLSVIGKIAAIYGQHFSDSVALAAVNEIETLSTGLSRKIWQKLMLLEAVAGDAGDAPKVEPPAGDS